MKILATGVSYADLLMREGVHPETPRRVPFTLGWDLAGVVRVATRLLPGGKRMRFYSVQRLKRRRPDWYQEDLTALLELRRQGKLQPIIAARLPLEEAARAHELLGGGGVTGKLVLLCDT